VAEGNRFSGVSLEQAVIRHAQEDMKNLGTPAAAQPVAVAAEPEGRKFGEGALLAMGRMGFKELAQALPAFPDSIRPVEEPGALGNLTPQMVTDQMGYESASDGAHRGQYQQRDEERSR
jgi:hypothetical protein